jgi:predicted kinase
VPAAYEPSPPGSGKTTLATALAPELGLPLLAKDTIKQALMAALPVPDIETSQALGIASTAAMLAVAGENTGAVLESVWYRERSLAALRKRPGPVVEVFCRCDPAVAGWRYAARSGSRAAGHFDAERQSDELRNAGVSDPVGGGWPVIKVRTDADVDIFVLAARVRAAAGEVPA